MKEKVTYKKSDFYSLNPTRVINDAQERRDWFAAFTNAVTYFEHYGYWAIRLYCSRENIQLTRKAKDSLKDLGAINIALFLRILKLIDNETYSDMRKIIKERNKLVHPSRKGITYRDKKKEDNAIRLLDKAKDCIQKIRSTIMLRTNTHVKKSALKAELVADSDVL